MKEQLASIIDALENDKSTIWSYRFQTIKQIGNHAYTINLEKKCDDRLELSVVLPIDLSNEFGNWSEVVQRANKEVDGSFAIEGNSIVYRIYSLMVDSETVIDSVMVSLLLNKCQIALQKQAEAMLAPGRFTVAMKSLFQRIRSCGKKTKICVPTDTTERGNIINHGEHEVATEGD